jgi:hypothetical protein
MLTRNAILYGVPLVLSIGTSAEVVRADALDQDGLGGELHRETGFSIWGTAPVECRFKQ